MVGLSVGRSVGRSVGLSVDRSVCQSVGWSVGRSVGQSVGVKLRGTCSRQLIDQHYRSDDTSQLQPCLQQPCLQQPCLQLIHQLCQRVSSESHNLSVNFDVMARRDVDTSDVTARRDWDTSVVSLPVYNGVLIGTIPTHLFPSITGYI